MEEPRNLIPAIDAMADIAAILDALDTDVCLVSDAERLALVAATHHVAGRLASLAATLAASTDRAQIADRSVGVPLVSWLSAEPRISRRAANRLVATGRGLARFEMLTSAAVSGRVSHEQATSIAGVLAKLPDDLPAEAVDRAEAHMLAYAKTFDAPGLAQLSRRLVEVIDPDNCDRREERRLQRELKAAKAARYLSFADDGCGSVLIRGSLPKLDAEPLRALVDAYAQQQRQAVDRLDPQVGMITPAMRRADALCALIAEHQAHSLGPCAGGDRPRVIVTIPYDQLLSDCLRAGILRSGEPITAGELRRLACDAGLLPAVLGGPSEVLDVGRERRLITAAQRVALTLRDAGCVFPGCDVQATLCHGHHVIPWEAGGPTELSNLVLLCPHHHNLVEPSKTGPNEKRWEIRIGADGVPELLPPV